MAGEDGNTDTRDAEDGQIPLSWAAGKGHKKLVNVLFGREEVDPSCSGKSGGIPLSLATTNGYVRIVNLLSERKDVDPITHVDLDKHGAGWLQGMGSKL